MELIQVSITNYTTLKTTSSSLIHQVSTPPFVISTNTFHTSYVGMYLVSHMNWIIYTNLIHWVEWGYSGSL